MAGGFWGADPEALRAHASLLRDRASSLAQLRERLEPAVLDESIWRGPDADTFRSTWTSRTAPAVDDVVAKLGGDGTTLDHEAEEQDTASQAGGQGAPGDGAPGDGSTPGGVWDIIPGGIEAYNKLQGLFSKSKKAWDLISDVRTWGRFLGGAEDVFQFAAGTWRYGQEITSKVLSTGKEYSGLASRLLGKLGLPTGFGPKNFFGWIDSGVGKIAEKVPFLTKAAPWLGKALPGIDIAFGGYQMIDSIGKGDTFHAITGGAQALGGSLMLAGGLMSTTGVGAIVGGPLAAAGAVITAGAALADVGKMVYDNWDSISETAGQVWDATTSAVGNAADAVGDFASDAGEAIGDGLSNAWHSVFG